MSRRRRRGREFSAGRLAHPPHSMRVVEACSAAVARGAAFVRPHCRTHITEIHSEAACAASAQSPSAALNGYDGTAPFHNTAYAASNALAPFRQDRAWLCRTEDSHGKARKSRNKISVAYNAIISVQYVILYYIARPICREPNGYVQSSLEI